MSRSLKKGIIVSCQPAFGNEPFYDYEFIKRMAQAAEFGGAVAVRIEGAENIKKIISSISIPVISLIKRCLPADNLSKRCITPTYEDVKELYEAGARIVAVDFTLRDTCNESFYMDLVKEIRKNMQIELLADVSNLEEGIMAMRTGANYISTTLSGYTPSTQKRELPDLKLLQQFSEVITIPYFGEGGYSNVDQVRLALGYGAYGVIMGTEITRPHIITKRFTQIFF